MKAVTKTGVKKGAPEKGGLRRSATREKEARVGSEFALAAASDVPAILGGFASEPLGDDTGESVTAPSAPASDVAVADVAVVARNDGATVNPEEANQAAEETQAAGQPDSNVVPTPNETGEADGNAEAESFSPEAVTPTPIHTANGAVVTRPGVVESPLARRMREEAQQRKEGKKTRTKVTSGSRNPGPEYELANATVKEIKAEIAVVSATAKAAVDEAIGSQITALRRQLLTLRQQKRAALAGADGEKLKELRARLKVAKAERLAARDNALANGSTSEAIAAEVTEPETIKQLTAQETTNVVEANTNVVREKE